MRILYVTTLSRTMGFFPEHIKMLKSLGHKVDYAGNLEGNDFLRKYDDVDIKLFDMPFSRKPFSVSNIKGVFKLRSLIKREGYDIVHCHTPNAAAITRFACLGLRKKGLKVFYTAHGFHFYKGAPLKNWLIYYPIEWLCAHFTDKLITINTEDYNRAKRHFHAGAVEYVQGVGINVEGLQKTEVDKNLKREELGIPQDAFLIISVGELNQNKNHQVVIKALAKLNQPNAYYIIAGRGNKQQSLNDLAMELNLEEKVKVLGFRSDVIELLKTSDVFCFPSVREGLSVSLMEAQSCGIPAVVSNIRGNTDIVENGVNGFTVKSNDEEGFAKALETLMNSSELCKNMANAGKERIKKFSIESVIKSMRKVYFD